MRPVPLPLALAALVPLMAQVPPLVLPRPHVQAVRTTEAPVIDGRLDDPAWRTAVPSDTFTQHFPFEGAPPSERTEVRILYDDDALYVGIDCVQVRSPVVRRLMRRDTQLPSDGIWIDIDSRRDGVSAFHFGVNAAGVLSDAIHFNDVEYSPDWDAVWEARVADTGHGYSVELRIPLAVLRFAGLPVQDWGFQVRRFIEARQETDDWAFYPRAVANYIPYFGRITGLTGLAPRRRLELRPFLLGRVRHRPPPDPATTGPLAHGTDLDGSAGLDAKVHLTNELTLDLTVNPDFGQVEADTVILNLSTFETFFPEKRPFFLEGIDAFSTIRPLLYTRRIGRQPAVPTLGTGEALIDNPEPSPIYGAAKVVGTVGGRTTVGLLSAVTGRNDVIVQLGDGTRVARAADVATAYNVLRLKHLVGANADVGLLATATNRFDAASNDAYVASADGRWRSPSGEYAAAAQAVTSLLEHGPPRPNRDGIAIVPGTPSAGGSLYVGKPGGAHWLWSAWQHLSGRQLEFNDVGYLERKNDYQASANLTYQTITPWWRTIETRTALQADLRQTLDGINLLNSLGLSTWWNLDNFWGVSAGAVFRGAHFDDREMGDGAALERAGLFGGWLSASTDPRRRVTAWVYAEGDRLSNGAHYEARGQVTFRLLPQMELDFIPTATWDGGEPRYVAPGATVTPTYLFGVQQARSVGATLRGAYTFTPELSLQVYTQVFLSRVHYPRFLQHDQVSSRTEVHLADLADAGPQTVDYDAQQATLNVNVVLRWEYRLGSTLFLVYTRAQSPSLVGPATSLDLRPVLEGRAATDVIMAKVAYWWG